MATETNRKSLSNLAQLSPGPLTTTQELCKKKLSDNLPLSLSHLLPAEHDVGGPLEAVDDALPAGVQVVVPGMD